MSARSVAFVGLGNMGLPMALNLLASGRAVRGFDLSSSAMAAAREAGLPVASALEEALAGADAVITMLPAGRHVVGAWSELVRHVPAGTLLLDCSTIDIDSAREAHRMAEGAGLASLDAPVSGGTGGARAATLTFMVGGSDEAFAAGNPLLEAMGKRIVHCGKAGTGQAAKICNNMILGVSMIAVSEAFVLAEKLGLSHQALFDVASTSSGQCWSLTSYCPVPGPVPASPANNAYKPGFAAALMSKDLRLAQDAARSAGAATPLGRHAAEIYEAFCEDAGGTDFSGIVERLRRQSGQ